MKQIKEKKVKYHQKKAVNNRLFTILDTIKKQNSELKNWIWNWIRKAWFEVTDFIGKLEVDNGKIKLLIKKIEETTFNFTKIL